MHVILCVHSVYIMCVDVRTTIFIVHFYFRHFDLLIGDLVQKQYQSDKAQPKVNV